jgi:hypothetical protein
MGYSKRDLKEYTMNSTLNTNRIALALLVWLFTLTGFYTIKAAPLAVSMQFTAIVTEVQDENNLLLGGIQQGASLTGTLTIPLDTTNSATVAGSGIYIFNSAASFTVSSGSLTFQTNPSNVQCRMEILKAATDITGIPYDSFMVRSDSNLPLKSSLTVDQICWQLTDPTSTAISGPQLPSLPLTLSNWQSVYGLMISGENRANPNQKYFVRGKVLTLLLVP